MAKRTDRTRTTQETLATAAAKTPAERVLALDARGALVPLGSGLPASIGGTSTPDATGQVGAPGNLNVFGYLTGEDYNPDLDGYAMFPNYNKMRLSDAQVNATLLMLKLPLKGATWTVKPATDDAQDVAIADFVQLQLLEDDSLARSWQHVLDNAMLKFDFGCSAEEIVWDLAPSGDVAMAEQRRQQLVELARTGQQRALEDVAAADGPVYARVKDLAPRLPRTFYRWIEDPKTNQLAFLQQYAPKNGQYGYFNIDATRLVLHVRNREGNAYYGRSVLRAAYPHWWWKQQLYRIDMIGHDRFHVGIPVAKLGSDYNANTAPLDKIEQTLKGLRSHDRAYMVQPFGVEYDVFTQKQTGGTDTLIQSVEHHNQMIARNILQSFTAQGEQKHGSFGAAKVTSDVYFNALEGEAEEIASEIKQSVVKRLCDLNFDMRGRKYPSIVCADISAVDFNQLAEAFSKLATARLLTPEDDLEDWLRDLSDAPQLPDELKGQSRQPVPPTPTAPAPAEGSLPPKNKKTGHGPIAASRYVERGRAFSRKPTVLERRVLDLHGLPRTLDSMTARLVGEMTRVRKQQLAAVAERIAQKDSRKTPAFTDIRHAHVRMPHTAEMQKAIRTAQTEAYDFGRQSVHDELTRQGATIPKRASLATSGENKSTAKSTLVSSAQITVKKQAETWKARIMDEGLRIRRTGVQGAELARRIAANLDDEAERGAKRDAAQELHEAFGIGRDGAARDLSDLIGGAIYSAILDANTCDVCSELDGDEFEIDSEDYDQNLPPNANCDGRDSCRCVYLYLAKEEAA